MGSAIASNKQNRSTIAEFDVAIDSSSSRAIADIIDDNERVFGSLVGPDGLTYVDGDTSRRVSNPVVAVVTGSRIVFAAMDERDNGGGSLDYTDLASVQIEDDRVVFTTSEGVRCEVPLSADEPGVDETCAHLHWVGDIRSRVVASSNDVDLAVGEIEDHAAAMEWEQAEAKYAEMRRTLDDLVVRLDATPVSYTALAPEITELERTLEKACVRMLVERAESEVALADQLLVKGDYDRVGSVLRDAERDTVRARSHAAVLERPDSFRFGEQREIFDSLDQVTEQIGGLATGLLESGHDARRRAATTGNPETAADLLETSLDCYRSFRDLGLAVDPGEPPSEATIQRLEETHASLREVANTAETQPADESRPEENGSRSQDPEAPPQMVTNGPAQAPAVEETAGDTGGQQESGPPPSDEDDSGTRVTDKVINQLTQAIRRSGAETE